MFFNLIIISIMLVAALFMAADYFYDETERNEINSKIQRAMEPVAHWLEPDVTAFWRLIVSKAPVLYGTALLAALCGFGLFLLFQPEWNIPELRAIAFALTILFCAGYMLCIAMLTKWVVDIGLPAFALFAIYRAAIFIIRCKKGSVFGIGFLILMISFVLRFAFQITDKA